MSQPSELSLARRALANLERVVRIDSASDDRSETIPTTPGQTELANDLAEFFAGLGGKVERDKFANIIASFPGVGRGVSQRPIALMVHLDTAHGTHAVERLLVTETWDGTAVPYPANLKLQVDVATYDATRPFLGHDLVHGPGDAPFGLDDKLGLTHLMSLAQMMAEQPEVERPPVLLIGRPDEEVGRVEALLELAQTLAKRNVDFGYTVDGIEPFEVNVENFNAARASVTIPSRKLAGAPAEGIEIVVDLSGVNTHGATAKAEGHRSAVRFAVEILEGLLDGGIAPHEVAPVAFHTDEDRECDGRLVLRLASEAYLDAVREDVENVVRPHVPRGAGVEISDAVPASGPVDGGAWDALQLVRAFLDDDTVQPLLAETSEGYQGYSHPNSVEAQSGAVVHFRLRDFDANELEERKKQVQQLAETMGTVEIADQYVNMASRLASRPELVKWALRAGKKVGADCQVRPIRGGTGVDPFLDAGVPVANLGTGYFAPESEKEFTSLQLMDRHARWLFALLGEIVEGRASA